MEEEVKAWLPNWAKKKGESKRTRGRVEWNGMGSTRDLLRGTRNAKGELKREEGEGGDRELARAHLM